MKNIFEKVIQDLEKIDWKDFNEVAISNKKILENIFDSSNPAEYLKNQGNQTQDNSETGN